MIRGANDALPIEEVILAVDIKQMLGLPNWLDARKAIAVQPHPDDNEVNIAGTLLALRERGCEVVYVTVTDGSAGLFGHTQDSAHIVRVREQEKRASATMLGVSRHIDLGFADGSSYLVEDVTPQLVEIFREERPDIVFTVDPWMPYEAHPDHVKVGLAVSRAILFSNNAILYPATAALIYQVPQVAFYATSYPNVFMDITSHFETKLASILAHKSQFDNDHWELLKQYFTSTAKESYAHIRGDKIGFAEALKVLSYLQLHALPGTLHD